MLLIWCVTKPFGAVPDGLEGLLGLINKNIANILKDPALIFEGIGQEWSDGLEQKGPAYTIQDRCPSCPFEGKRLQDIEIHYNFVGAVTLPESSDNPQPKVGLNTRKGVVVEYAPAGVGAI